MNKTQLDALRISCVDVRVYSTQYDTEFRNPHLSFPGKHAVLVFVTTEGGEVGVGESWCDGGDPGAVVTLIESDLVPRIIGGNVSEPERLWESMMATEAMSLKGSALSAAVSGVDIAVWDALARSVGQPLYRLLGGHADAVPVYGSAGLYAEGYSPDMLAADMSAAIRSGCCGAKIKVAGARVEEDVERVAVVREAIGPEPRLMVDALFKPDVAGAIRLGKALSPFDIYFLEAPTDRRNIAGWQTVRRNTGLALSGAEVESEFGRFREFLAAGAVDYLQADAIICGGITALRRIAALGRAYHQPTTFHASGSAVALAANAQVAAAFAGSDCIEMHLLHQALFDRLWDAGWQVENGRLRLPQLSGIGLEIRHDDPVLEPT